MSLYRQGQLSTYDPATSAIDSFSIKRNYATFDAASLEISDHFNHYFDACIKIEKNLPKFLGTNIKAFYPLTTAEKTSQVFKQVEGNQLFMAHSVTDVTLTSNGQEFSLTTPAIFGAAPFKDTSFAVSVRVDEADSTAEGAFANINPSSSELWNTLSNQNHYLAAVVPASGLEGRTFSVKVSTLGRTILPGGLISFSENLEEGLLGAAYMPIVGGTDFSLTPSSTGLFPKHLSSNRYQLDYYGIAGGSVYPNNPTQVPFIVAAKNSIYGGFSVLNSPDNRVVGLSSFTTAARFDSSTGGYLFGAAARSGIAYGIDGLDNPTDQFISFRLCGFASDNPFYGRNFGCVGPAVRISGLANNANFYALVLGDAPGSLTTSTSGNPLNETGPRTAYLAKFKNVNLSNSLAETVLMRGTTGTAPYVSTAVSGVTILSATTTLVYSASDLSYLYRLAASGNTIILQQEGASGLFTNVLTYTDSDTITQGYPGFFSVGKEQAQDNLVKPNRWLFLDSIKMGNLSTGSTLPLKLKAFYTRTGLPSSYNVFTNYTSSETIIDPSTTPTASGAVLRWNDNANSVYRGCDTVPLLPWGFGFIGTRAVPEPGALFLNLGQSSAWSPNIHEFSALLVAPSGFNIANGDYVAKFRITTGSYSGFYTNYNNDLRTKFEFGISDSSTARSRSESYEENKIQYIKVPLSNITFSSQTLGAPKTVDFVIPMNVFDTTMRHDAITFYIKGEMQSTGGEGVRISDILIGPR